VIAIVDYGLGNLGSVTKAFRHVGAPVTLTGDADRLQEADALVVPGDGAFATAMDELRRRGLLGVLRDAVSAGRPFLGICVGMQLLFEESEEHGCHAGLGFLRGSVKRFGDALVVPHMGWNRLRQTRPDPLLAGVADGSHVYFVHSYYCDARPEDTVAEADYGLGFPAIVRSGSVVGMQFHPEKSQAIGLRLIANFVGEARARGAVPAHTRVRA
jgi:imidazole glycerol-phosphate synthase subunit HisH